MVARSVARSAARARAGPASAATEGAGPASAGGAATAAGSRHPAVGAATRETRGPDRPAPGGGPAWPPARAGASPGAGRCCRLSAMGRRVVSMTLDNLDDLPPACRRCVFWELDPVARSRAEEAGDTAFEREAWVSATLLEWGSCGHLLYVDEVPAGFVTYAPPAYAPRSLAFPTSPPSPDAVLLMTAHVVPEFRGGGLGRVLLQHLVKDLQGRGVRAIEAFGTHQPTQQRLDHCVVPVAALTAVGFKTIRPHPHWPRLRLEIKSAVSWREDVEVALERLLASMTPDALRPVGAGRRSASVSPPAAVGCWRP